MTTPRSRAVYTVTLLTVGQTTAKKPVQHTAQHSTIKACSVGPTKCWQQTFSSQSHFTDAALITVAILSGPVISRGQQSVNRVRSRICSPWSSPPAISMTWDIFPGKGLKKPRTMTQLSKLLKQLSKELKARRRIVRHVKQYLEHCANEQTDVSV